MEPPLTVRRDVRTPGSRTRESRETVNQHASLGAPDGAPGCVVRCTGPALCTTRILDDIGYVQQSREEMEVLFTFLAERYERRSVILTSNLVFSEWGRIFKDPMTTAAAIDRLVHHSVILEMTGPSVRAEEALQAGLAMNTEPMTGTTTVGAAPPGKEVDGEM